VGLAARTPEERPCRGLVAAALELAATRSGIRRRPLSGGAANATVNLIAPASANFDRYTQLDLRVGKSIRVGAFRAAVNLDMFNALNASSVLALNTVFGGTRPWLTPQSIMQGRLLKVSAQLDF